MATKKSEKVTSKVSAIYTLENGTDVTVARDEEVNTVRCIHVRMNQPIEGVPQKPTTFNVQYSLQSSEINVNSLGFGLEGDSEIQKEIEECVMDLVNWKVDGE